MAVKGIIVEIGGDTVGLQKALKDVNDRAKNVSSEMREVEKALKLDPTNVTLLAQKHELLSKQVAIAREKLDALKSVQGQVEEQFRSGKIGEEQYRAFQREVAIAESNVKKLDGKIADMEKTADSAEEDTQELAESLEKAGKSGKNMGEDLEQSEGKMSKFGNAVKQIGTVALDVFKALGTAAVDAGKKIWSMSNDVASTGDAIDKTSQKIGISAEAYQEWGYVFERCGADVNNLQGGMKTLRTAIDNVRDSAIGGTVDTDKLNKAQTKYKNAVLDLEKAQITYNVAIQKSGENSDAAKKAFLDLQKAQNKVADAENSYISAQQGTTPTLSEAGKALKELGVETSTTSGELRSEEEVFADTITALQSMTNETERARYASLIFGKSGTELAALLNTSAADTQALKDEAHEYGMVMSNDAVAASATFEDSLTRMNNTVTGLKNNMIGELLPGVTLIMDGITDFIAGTGNGGQYLEEGIMSVIDTITAKIPQVTELLNMVLSSVAKSIPSVIQSMVSAVPDMLQAIMEALVSLVQAVSEQMTTLAPQLTTALMQMLQILTGNLPLLLQAGLQLVQGLVEGILEAIPAMVAELPKLVLSIVDFIIGSIPSIIQAGVDLLTALVEALPDIIKQIVEVLPEIITGIIDTLMENLPLMIQAGIDLLIALVDDLPKIITTIVDAIPKIIEKVIDAVIKSIPKLIEAGIKLFIALVENLPKIITGIIEAIPKIITSVIKALIDSIPKLIEAGIKLFVSIIQNLPQIITTIVSKLPEIIKGIVDGFGSLLGAMAEIGTNMLKGLWDGISGAAGWLWEQVSGWASGLWDGICGFFGIHSPSTLFRDTIGKNLALGIGEGFTDTMDTVNKDMQDALPTEMDIEPSVNAVAQTVSNVSGFGQPSVVFTMNIENFYNQTDKDLKELMEYASSYLNAQMQRRSVVF